MSTGFPTTLDTYTVLVDNTDNIVAAHPNDRGDAIEALEAKVGINSSAVATTHDYLLEHLPTQAANWDAGPYEVRAETFESDVATGTAPMTIASTTVVTNLNANTVNGKSAPSGTIVGTTDSQTLTNKTLTSPVVNTGDINTPDIDGGTLDGITIGASSAPTVTDLGSVATCDINGGTVDATAIGGATPAAGSFTTIASSGQSSLTTLQVGAGAIVTTIENSDSLGTSDTKLCTQGNVKAYADELSIGDIEDYGTSASASTSKAQSALKICYGQISIAGDGNQAITNLPFTSSTSYAISVCGIETAVDLTHNHNAVPNSGSQATIYNGTGGTISIMWTAIGT